MKKLMIAVSVALSMNVYAKPKVDKVSDDNVFYVYQDKGSKKNHWIPSGWMGSFSGIKFNDAWKEDCLDGMSCIKIDYNPKNTIGAMWHGIYWQHVANNWGNKAGGFDMKGYKRVTFWAKAGEDNTTINEFKIGGITGEFSDSDSASIGPITLTKDWKKYEIKLDGLDLQKIIGGFCYATADDVIPEKGMTLFLDEVRYEK